MQMIEGQMSMFDFLRREDSELPDINEITEQEAVRIVGEQLGVDFTYNDYLQHYEAKKGKTKMDICYSHYTMKDNHDLFLSVGWSDKTEGAGSPCDSIKEAIKFFERMFERKGYK